MSQMMGYRLGSNLTRPNTPTGLSHPAFDPHLLQLSLAEHWHEADRSPLSPSIRSVASPIQGTPHAFVLARSHRVPHNRTWELGTRGEKHSPPTIQMAIFLLVLLGYGGVLLTKSAALLPMDIANFLQPSGWLGLIFLVLIFSWVFGE